MSTLVRLPNGKRVVKSDRQTMLGSCCTTCDDPNQLGWVQAAVGIASAASSLLGKKKEKAPDPIHQFFYDYGAGGYGSRPGRAYEENFFERAWQGFRELGAVHGAAAIEQGILQNSTINPWGVDQIPHWYAYKIADAICKGVISPSASTSEAFEKVIWPQLGPVYSRFWPRGDVNYYLFFDWTDRVLANLPVGQVDRNQRYEHITPIDVLKKLCPEKVPAPAAAPVTPTPVATSPTAPTPVPTPSVQVPTSGPQPIASPGQTQTTGSNEQQIQALINSMLSQGATQQQAFSSALQALASKGVTITPQVQTAVAEQVKSSAGIPVWIWPAAGLAVLGTFMLARRKGK